MDNVHPKSNDNFLRCTDVRAQYLRSPMHWRSAHDLCRAVTVLAVSGTIRGWSCPTGCDMMNRLRRDSGFSPRMEVIQLSVR